MKVKTILLVLMLIGGVFCAEALADLTKSGLKRGFESIVNPGELSQAHRIREINDCTKCHEYYGEIPESKCFTCHKIIQTRREAGAGYHGRKKDKCIHCHKEHLGAAGSIVNFDKEKFDHAVAAFPLEGKHKNIKCEKCHHKKISEDGNNPAGYYVGLRHDACLDCHKDIHTGIFGEKKCEACHSAAGWKGQDLKFDHGRAKFSLEGKHASVTCDKCHKTQTPGAVLGTAVFTGMKFGLCDDCHKDPHRGKLRGGCASCHSVQGWKDKNLKFDHSRAKFPLEGKHTSVKCDKCHKPQAPGAAPGTVAFTGVKFGLCSDCHKDPHRGEFKATCSVCHSVQGWRDKDLLFDHGRDARYRLAGKHQSVTCVKCHKSRTKDGLPDVASFRVKHASCADCHKDPHRGEIKASCAKCHAVQGWSGKNLMFDHGRDTGYRLEGKHQPVKCVKCHKTTRDGLLDVTSFSIPEPQMCAPCHKHKHKGNGKFVVACDYCHHFNSWKKKGT